MRTLTEVLNGAREDLKERWDDYRSEFDPEGYDWDVIHVAARHARISLLPASRARELHPGRGNVRRLGVPEL